MNLLNGKNKKKEQSINNSDYLNFIRKNHLKFESSQLMNKINQFQSQRNATIQKNAILQKNTAIQIKNTKLQMPNINLISQNDKQFHDKHISLRNRDFLSASQHDNNKSPRKNNQLGQIQMEVAKQYNTIDFVNHKNKDISSGSVTMINPKIHAKNSKQKMYFQNIQHDNTSQNQLINKQIILTKHLQQNQKLVYDLKQKNREVALNLLKNSNTHFEKHQINQQSQKNQINQYSKNVRTETPTFLKKKYQLSVNESQAHIMLEDNKLRIQQKNKSRTMQKLSGQRYLPAQNKKFANELKFPAIYPSSLPKKIQKLQKNRNRESSLSNYINEQKNVQIDYTQCNIVKNSKIKKNYKQSKQFKQRSQKTTTQAQKQHQGQNYQRIKQNQSIQIMNSYNNYDEIRIKIDEMNSQRQEFQKQLLDSLRKQHLQQKSTEDLIKRIGNQHSNIKNNSLVNNNIGSVSNQISARNNYSLSLIKRRRNVPQKLTNFLTSKDTKPQTLIKQRSQLQRSVNQLKKSVSNYNQSIGNNLSVGQQQQKSSRKMHHKQRARQRQKQFEKYLIQNSILKSTKIVNYYDKQEEKKKTIFNQLQQNYYLNQINKDDQIINKNDFIKEIQQNQKILLGDSNKIDYSTSLQGFQSKFITSDQAAQRSELMKQFSSNLLNVQKSPFKKKQNIPTYNRRDPQLSIYQNKIRSYRQFIFMMGLTHKIILPLPLKPAAELKNQVKFKYFVGQGNNRLLIKSLMNRRFWWEEVKDQKKAHFVWTQLKINSIFQNQNTSQYKSLGNRKFDKLNQDIKDDQITKKKKKLAVKPGQKNGALFKAPLPQESQMKIFTLSDKVLYKKYMSASSEVTDQQLISFTNRVKHLPTSINSQVSIEWLYSQKMHNHLQCNFFIGNKKALFYNIKHYYSLLKKDPFQIIPFTLHIKNGMNDASYQTFLKEHTKIAKQVQSKKSTLKNVWIVKPGELSNRGQGITVIDEVYELNVILKKKEKHKNGIQKSYILQKYIEKPLLYKGRKFDIRHYMLLTRINGRFRAYFYGEGYIRTSSCEFNLQELDEMIHLTNDAIQKDGAQYGKHQQGNKLGYSEFQRYLDSVYGQGKVSFVDQIYKRMKQIALDSVKATYLQLDPKSLQNNFEVLGLDFMIDTKFNVFMIQVNTNPCLELSSKLLERIIPQMVQNTLRICVDPLFPVCTHYPNSLKHMCPDNALQRLPFELIFDEARDGQQLQQLFKKSNLNRLLKDMGQVDEEDVTFQSNGKEIEIEIKQILQP